jgi:TusA-related sulfurtransferase
MKISGPTFLDITADVCPLTFVRTRLLLEGMAAGDLAEIRLQGAEPLTNVPRTLRAEGHEIVSLTPEDPAGGASSVHRLSVRKAAD